MSWSFDGVGKREAICAAIDKSLAGYGAGQSRDEYEASAPHLKALVMEAGPGSVVAIAANGHATFVNGEKTHGNIRVDIKQIGPLCE